MLIQAPKGTKDIFGDEVYIWQEIEKNILEVCNLYSIEEIRTPIFEHTELFQRGVGETTDVVQKEMYTFLDKGNRSVTLKPEGTAGAVRAYLEHGLFVNKQPTKLFYSSSHFRYEQPQSGRYRQFHQFGVEYFGSGSPACDAEVISVAYNLLERLQIKNTTLELNSLGCPDCRKKYNETLINYLTENIDGLCETCRERLNKNPLRVLDCKEDFCQDVIGKAPLVLDSLDDECREHFQKVQEILTSMKIEFKINPKIVRGLDYYTKTVFEFITKDVNGSIGGGGRYDGLVKELGGASTPAVGFAMGIERLVLALKEQNNNIKEKPIADIYVGSIGEKGFIESQAIVFELRKKGIIAEADISQRSVKAQMKYANKLNVKYTIILGDHELETNKANIKNMQTSESEEILVSDIYEYIIKKRGVL